MRPFDELIMIMTWTFFQCGIYQLLVDSQHIEPLNRVWIFSLLWAWISFWTNLQVANEMSCINACMWCEPNVLSYQWFYAKFSKCGDHLKRQLRPCKMCPSGGTLHFSLLHGPSWSNIFHITSPLWAESSGHQWIPSQRPVMCRFDVFFDLRLNKWLSKQSIFQWFEMPSTLLWRHCNVIDIKCYIGSNGQNFCFVI